jgi:hypothetical protein
VSATLGSARRRCDRKREKSLSGEITRISDCFRFGSALMRLMSAAPARSAGEDAIERNQRRLPVRNGLERAECSASVNARSSLSLLVVFSFSVGRTSADAMSTVHAFSTERPVYCRMTPDSAHSDVCSMAPTV